MRTVLLFSAVCLALAGCNNPPAANDAATPGNDAFVTPGNDTGVDAAASTPDTGAMIDTGPVADGCAMSFAGCTTFEDHTGEASVTIMATGSLASFAYAPKCIRISAGTDVTIVNSLTHPLLAATCSPDTTPIPDAPDMTLTTFTFDDPGNYGYYCMNHGANDGTGMSGLIVVE